MKIGTSYPLVWPKAWPRTTSSKRLPLLMEARKGLGLPAALKRLQRELEWLGAEDVVLSLDADPRKLRKGAEAADPGAAVYFCVGAQTYVLACDRWQRAGDNVIALARHIRAVAASLEHFGVGTLAQAFAGYVGPPAPGVTARARSWRTVLHVPEGERVTVELVNARYRELAKKLHPDQPSGSHAAMTELNLARAAALRDLGH